MDGEPLLWADNRFRRGNTASPMKIISFPGRPRGLPSPPLKHHLGPAQQVDDESDDENGSEYAAADVHVNLRRFA